jgi:hypothetical protein
MIYGVEYQYGDTYIWKRGGLFTLKANDKRIRVCVMTARNTDADDLSTLAILSERLGIPLIWNTSVTPQTFSLRVKADHETEGS